jgi:uncharacterized Zn finger protein
MNLDKLNRSVLMLCPTCGNSEMESLNGPSYVSELLRCNSCELVITKDDFVKSNQENIDANLEEMKKLAAKEIKSELEKMFKKAFK